MLLQVRTLFKLKFWIFPVITYFRYHVTEYRAVIGTHSTVRGDKLLYGQIPDPFPRCGIVSGHARLIIPMLFCWSAIPTSCYIFNVFYSCSCHFSFSSRCMLELKFAIYYRAASLPSQASYAVLAEESLSRPGFLQTLPAHQQYS